MDIETPVGLNERNPDGKSLSAIAVVKAEGAGSLPGRSAPKNLDSEKTVTYIEIGPRANRQV